MTVGFPATNTPGRRSFIRTILSLPLVGFLAVLWAQSASCSEFLKDWARMKDMVPEGYVCYQATAPLTINGRLDDSDWAKAPWTRDFQDIEGTTKPAPRFRTRAKMLWDDHYFYVAAELEEPHVWATLTNHDSVIFRDNDFEIFIDPNGDKHEYFEIEINALNTEWDLLLTKPYIDGGPPHDEWEIPGLKTAVHVNGTLNNAGDTDKGWTVEIAFPWKALSRYAHRPAPPREGDQWRVDFSRVEWQIRILNGKYEKVPNTPENNWIWSPPGIVDMHRPEKWGYVQFTARPPGTVTYSPDPAALARNVLQAIYYAERDYEAAHHRWAWKLSDLNLPHDFWRGLPKEPTLHGSRDGFEAIAEIRSSNGKTERWHIRQDNKTWRN